MATTPPPTPPPTLGQQLKQMFQLVEALGDTFPPQNFDGSANAEAQQAALNAIAAAAEATGLLQPLTAIVPQISPSQVAGFVVSVYPAIKAYEAATRRPTI